MTSLQPQEPGVKVKEERKEREQEKEKERREEEQDTRQRTKKQKMSFVAESARLTPLRIRSSPARVLCFSRPWGRLLLEGSQGSTG